MKSFSPHVTQQPSVCVSQCGTGIPCQASTSELTHLWLSRVRKKPVKSLADGGSAPLELIFGILPVQIP